MKQGNVLSPPPQYTRAFVPPVFLQVGLDPAIFTLDERIY